MSYRTSVTVFLDPDSECRPKCVLTTDGRGHFAVVELGDHFATVQTKSVEALLNAAEAFREAARRLQAARVALVEDLPA